MQGYVRGDPATIDAAWMTEALERAGVARGAEITDLTFAGFIGTGQMSRNGRFHLSWDQPEGRPASVVGKFPSGDPPTKASSFESGVYLAEVAFYAEIVSTLAVRTPACWVARYDERTPDFVLIMEDLADSVQGDQFVGATLDEADLAIGQAVGLHAPRWGDPSLAGLTALQPADKGRADLLDSYYGGTVSGCLDRLGHRFDADVRDLVERFAGVIRAWTLGSGSPHTIVHGDFRPDNFLLGRTPDAPAIAVVDWQTVHKGLGACDVAYLLGGAFAPEERAPIERELVEQYRDRLNAAGVAYTAADAWRDYRWGSLHGVIIAVCATMMAEQTERGDEMLTLMVNRHAQHAIDLDALSLIDP